MSDEKPSDSANKKESHYSSLSITVYLYKTSTIASTSHLKSFFESLFHFP